MEAPAAFYEREEINPAWLFHWEAFNDLSSERQIGMGVGPIPRSAIKAYAEEFDIVGDAFDKFYRIIREVDLEYLKQINSTSGKSSKDETVPVDDVDGVKNVMGRLAARAPRKQKTH